jgi:hypothetical protein
MTQCPHHSRIRPRAVKNFRFGSTTTIGSSRSRGSGNTQKIATAAAAIQDSRISQTGQERNYQRYKKFRLTLVDGAKARGEQSYADRFRATVDVAAEKVEAG